MKKNIQKNKQNTLTVKDVFTIVMSVICWIFAVVRVVCSVGMRRRGGGGVPISVAEGHRP